MCACMRSRSYYHVCFLRKVWLCKRVDWKSLRLRKSLFLSVSHTVLVLAACGCDGARRPNSCLYEAGLQHLNGHSLWNACCQQVFLKSSEGGGTGCPSVPITKYLFIVKPHLYEMQETIYNITGWVFFIEHYSLITMLYLSSNIHVKITCVIVESWKQAEMSCEIS